MENLLNFLPQFVLLGSIWWFIVSVILLVTFLFVSESKGNGFIALFFFVAFCLANYYWGDFNVFKYFSWISFGVYICVGLIYALFKTYLYAKKERAKTLDSEYSTYEQKRSNALSSLKGNVFRWWFMWPVSLIYWALSDLISDVYNYLYLKVGKFFTKVFDKGFGHPTKKEIEYENSI